MQHKCFVCVCVFRALLGQDYFLTKLSTHGFTTRKDHICSVFLLRCHTRKETLETNNAYWNLPIQSIVCKSKPLKILQDTHGNWYHSISPVIVSASVSKITLGSQYDKVSKSFLYLFSFCSPLLRKKQKKKKWWQHYCDVGVREAGGGGGGGKKYYKHFHHHQEGSCFERV